MQTSYVPTPSQSHPGDDRTACAQNPEFTGYNVSPMTLAKLDFGLFRTLRKLDTSPERICSALGISASDYEYINEIAGV
jgi:hypothetical protein